MRGFCNGMLLMKQVCSHKKKRELLFLLFLEVVPGRKGCLSFPISPPADPPSLPVPSKFPFPSPRQFCPARGADPLWSGEGHGGPCGFPGAALSDASGCTGLVCRSCQPSQGTTLVATFGSPWAAEEPSRSGLSCRNHPQGPRC